MSPRVHEAVKSAARVFAYTMIGAFLATVAPLGTESVPDVRTVQDAATAAAWAGFIALLGFVWNLLSPRVPVDTRRDES